MEIENKRGQLSGSEEVKQHLREFVKDISFGDAKYQAFFDWNNEEELDGEIAIIHKQQEKGGITPAQASSLRITEFRIALLQHDIERKKSSVKGYMDAYWTFRGNLEDLYELLYTEENEKHLEDEAASDLYVDNEWNSFKSELTSILYK